MQKRKSKNKMKMNSIKQMIENVKKNIQSDMNTLYKDQLFKVTIVVIQCNLINSKAYGFFSIDWKLFFKSLIV